MTHIQSAALAVLFALSGSASAVTLVSWDLVGTPGNQASTPGVAGSGLSGMNLTRGAGLAATAAGGSFSSSGWGGQATDYYSFGFSVDAGFTVDLASLYLGTRSSGTGPGVMGLFWSGDSFVAPLTSFTQVNTAFLNSVVDLSALPVLSGDVEFRLVQIGTASANGGVTTASGGTFRVTPYFVQANFDRNLQFTGQVAVIPEPGSLALLLAGLGVVGFVASRRRG